MNPQILAAFIGVAATIGAAIAGLMWRMSNSLARLDERVKHIEQTIQDWNR